MGNNINLDSWRLERSGLRRKDDEIIDQLCQALLASQAKVQELEAEIARPKVEPSEG